MVLFEYKDFDQLYHDLSRVPFHEYDKYQDYLVKSGSTYYMDNVVIESTSYDCTIDMSKLNYTIAKWTTLVNRYVDPQDYLKLRDKLKTSNKKTCTFNFRHDIEGHDACIIALVFTRENPKGKWNKVSIEYRITDVVKKFAVDLILLNRMFTDLPNLDLTNITFYFPKLFFRVEFMAELIGEYFKLDEFSNDSFASKHVTDLWNRYYTQGAELSNYHSISRKQKLKARSSTLPELPIESLKLFDGIEVSLFE